MTEVAVIGSGIFGLACAFRLVEAGVRVRVYDDGGPVATAAAAGMLTPSFEAAHEPFSPDLLAFAYEGLALWPEFAAALAAETGIDVDLRFGALGVARDDAEAVRLAHVAGTGIARLSPEEARRLEPALAPVAAAVFAPAEGEVDPRLALEALRAALGRRGVREARRVETLVADGAGFRIGFADGGAANVETVVLAAGALAGRIGGVAAAGARTVFPVMGEALALDAPTAPLRHVVRGEGVYLCPKTDGRVVVGATSLAFGGALDVDDARIRGLRGKAEGIVPALAALRERERWAGLRPATPDGAPLLGPHRDGPARLFFALGGYRNGVLLAPAVAAAIAEGVGGGSPAGFAAFAPDRFGHD